MLHCKSENPLYLNDKPIYNPQPGFQIKYRIFDESQSFPAMVIGIDTQGRGSYSDTLYNLNSDEMAIINRYEQKAWGMYLGFSKNWITRKNNY